MNAVFKDRLKIALEQKNMRPIELSRVSGINRSSISMYLSGANYPNRKNLNLLASILNVNESWLLGYDVVNADFQKSYHIKLKIRDSTLESTIQAISKHEAIGKALEIVPTATYKDIIEIKEDA